MQRMTSCLDYLHLQADLTQTPRPAMARPSLVVVRRIMDRIEVRHGELGYTARHQYPRALREHSVRLTHMLQNLVACNAIDNRVCERPFASLRTNMCIPKNKNYT